jgi:glycosyltransferase involved in cell wall biosynthesis
LDEFKRKLLRESAALLITSQVDETSSLVAIEAAASGIPVVAFRRGALPEVVKNEVTGFVVEDVDDAVEALKEIENISCEDCARYAQTHFSSAKMAGEYQRLYSLLLQREELFKAA